MSCADWVQFIPLFNILYHFHQCFTQPYLSSLLHKDLLLLGKENTPTNHMMCFINPLSLPERYQLIMASVKFLKHYFIFHILLLATIDNLNETLRFIVDKTMTKRKEVPVVLYDEFDFIMWQIQNVNACEVIGIKDNWRRRRNSASNINRNQLGTRQLKYITSLQITCECESIIKQSLVMTYNELS